ncbi:MAG: hypothetical protein ACRDWD_04575 [Acidimicrobiia bacterium]
MTTRTRILRFITVDGRAALVPWIVGRVLVIGSLAVARFAFDESAPDATRPAQLGQGLFSWDAAFYRDIAEGGYDAVPRSGLRFFPLYPLAGRALGFLLAHHTELALLVVANLSALLFGALLYRLAVIETGDARFANRAAWFAGVFPAGMVLVMGYAEGLFLALAAGMFLALRRRAFLVAAPLGLLAGLTRPGGALLALPALIEGLREWRLADLRGLMARATAVLAPLAALAIYLAWVGRAYGDAFLPLRLQSDPSRRGGLRDPVSRMIDAVGDLAGGDRFGSGLHVVWAVLFVLLLVVLIRRFPASYSAYAGVSLFLLLSARNLDSFERYAMGTFPFLLALAAVSDAEEVERPAIGLTAAGLVAYSVLVFLGVYVP